MGDRHGDCFARRGRALSPPRPRVDAHPAVVFRRRAVVGRICPARERSPRRKSLDTAHKRKDLPRARTFPTAKASRHGARAKGFAPPRNAPLGEGLPARRTSEKIYPREKALLNKSLPTRRTSEGICPRAGTRPSAKASRHGAKAKGFAPRRVPSRPTCRRTAGRPRPTDSRKTPLRRGRTREGAAAAEFIHRKKIRLLHETQLFYGESHVGSRQIFPSFPSVGRCVARERNPVPPVAPHRGSEHHGLRRDGEMCHGFGEMVHRFDTMCPHGGKSLPRGGNGCPRGSRCYPSIRCFGERFHRRRCANPDACRGQRCSRG